MTATITTPEALINHYATEGVTLVYVARGDELADTEIDAILARDTDRLDDLMWDRFGDQRADAADTILEEALGYTDNDLCHELMDCDTSNPVADLVYNTPSVNALQVLGTGFTTLYPHHDPQHHADAITALMAVLVPLRLSISDQYTVARELVNNGISYALHAGSTLAVWTRVDLASYTRPGRASLEHTGTIQVVLHDPETGACASADVTLTELVHLRTDTFPVTRDNIGTYSVSSELGHPTARS